ncbi:hypothetical protein TOPH_05780 [Tolypocladium ophioglossoides CBS 100239]|uniref:Uncharacterized protein n=1 Tax=Tolypocladium ophioglossoides (strain CBS 100239) TaxID=1163406 RepID=A0A0L0N6F1_TOLOC|nr:hypothetical protein TOPH_05780 [Tolypocladium ophioglossoides CBS 100239]
MDPAERQAFKLPFFLPMTMEHPFEFVVSNPENFEASQARPVARSSTAVRKRKHGYLLTKKLPQDEQDWDMILHSQDDFNRVLHRLILAHISPNERVALCWNELFQECAKHFEVLSQDNSEENPIELFKLAVIGLSKVALKEGHPRDKTYDYLRSCLRSYYHSDQQLGDESLRKLGKVVREGIKFIESFTDILGSRSNELPLYAPQAIRDILLPKFDLLPRNWLNSGANFPPPHFLIANRSSSGIRITRRTHTLGLKQAAISIILSEVIINSRPILNAKGLYSYHLPPPCQLYLDTALKCKKIFKNLVALERRPKAFRSEAGTTMWPTSGGALVLPLTNESTDVALLERITGTARREVWHPESILYLEHEGLTAIKGSIHYIYALLKVEANPGSSSRRSS